MSKLTFSTFMRIVEDAEQDVQKLMADIASIDAQLAQRTGPLLQRKMALTKQLQQKQQQVATTTGSQQPGQPSAMQTTTTTPGGSQQATPGTPPPGAQ